MKVQIYTYSGARAFRQQTAFGGYVLACTLKGEERTVERFLLMQDMTENQSEIALLAAALGHMNKSSEIEIYTESPYLEAGLKNWLPGWKESGWMRKDGKPVANKKEWIVLEKRLEPHTWTMKVKEAHKYREWLRTEVERRQEKCLKNSENLTR